MVEITNLVDPDQGSDYTPGSTVQLVCSADGPFDITSTVWNSTCTGGCFVLQQTSQPLIMKDILHSTDSGNHTCTIIDDVGNSGSATVEIQVTGKYAIMLVVEMLLKLIISRCTTVLI